jgi:acyl dehydratase
MSHDRGPGLSVGLDESILDVVVPIDEARWTSGDTVLYALAVGAGLEDPTGPELAFATEDTAGVPQLVLPTFAVIPGTAKPAYDAFADRLDGAVVVHAEHQLQLHGPIPAAGAVRNETSILRVWDSGRSALLDIETRSFDTISDELLFTNLATLHVRGAGGFGGERRPPPRPAPDRAPDLVRECRTTPNQALLYRLTGDRTAMHADPVAAAASGFDAPILHGLCTLGMTGRLLLGSWCDSDPSRVQAVRARFVATVRPGAALAVAMWDVGEGVIVFATTSDAGDTVLADGELRLSS